MKYFVYVMSNKNRTLFKTNITENIEAMLNVEHSVHREVYKKSSGINELIYSEECETLDAAVKRRDELKASARELFCKNL